MSPNDLLTCCPNCAAVAGNGCQGGYMNRAFEYLKSTGVTTGEIFGDNTVCKPYFLSPTTYSLAVAPACSANCVNSSISNSKLKIASYKTMIGEAAIISELNATGSVSAAFMVYADFYTYKSGIYSSNMKTLYGGHAITIIGYGVDSVTGNKYWIIRNSWGSFWGEKGFFRMIRGTNNCKLETITAFSVKFA